MRRILLLLALCLLTGGLFAQERQPFFYKLYADDGLTSDRTTRVIQDHLGFIWVGTEEGLNKVSDFNAIETFRFDRKDSSSLSNDHVTALYVDSRKRLWVGTRNGLNLYFRDHNNFQRIKPIHLEGHGYGVRINDIKEDHDQNLWVICHNHLVWINGDNLEEKRVFRLEDESINMIKLAVFESRLRVATSKGIYTQTENGLEKSGMAKDLPVTDLLANKSELWISTANKGLIRYDAISGETREYNSGKGKLKSDHVNDLAMIDESEIWISTIGGISRLNIDTEEVQHHQHDFDNPFSLSDRVIRQTYQDRAGNVWITTPNSGVNYYHKADNLFGYYGQTEKEGTTKDLMDYGIMSILAHQNVAWLGSRKGISKLENGKFEHYPFQPDLQQWITGVYALVRDEKGNFWLGTDYKLLKWSPISKKYSVFESAALTGNMVNTMALVDETTIWIGTEKRGVQLLGIKNGSLRDLKFSAELENRQWPAVQAILPIEGQVLVGTRQGLFSVRDGKVFPVELNKWNDNLSDDLSVSVLKADPSGNVLVGTKQDGVLILDDQLIPAYQIGKKEGMSSQDIRSISVESNESVWVGTNAGVSRLTREGNAVSAIRNFDIQDGLQSNHFSERSEAQMANGHVLMGGLSGLTVFHPKNILDFEIEQNLNIVSLSVNGEKMKVGKEGSPLVKDMTMTDKIVLSPEQKRFTIGFNALDFVRSTDVTYRYQLKGHKAEWTELKGANSVTYQNLSGGRVYTFMVQSKGRYSGWSSSKELKIYIEPFYYETIWFQLLAVILGGLLIGLIIWWRANINSIKKRELERMIEERSTELQEEVTIRRETEQKLKEALTEAERASEIKSQFLANMSHEIRTPLNGIMGMTELTLESELTEEQHTMLDTIYKSTQSLKSIVNDILDIAKIEAGVLKMVNERFSVHDTLEQVMASFQPQANRKNLSLKHWVLPKVPKQVLGDAGRLRQVLVNLLANAMKFTHNGSITVIVDAMNQRSTSLELWFTVTDSGIGIPEYQQAHIFKSFMQVESGPSRAYGGTGLGLSISKELVEKMGGEIWVESEEGKGSIFSFYIRVEEAAGEEQQHQPTEEINKPIEALTGKVLIVEDIPTNQLVIAKMSEKIGLEPTCVISGREALAALKKEHFDLVLMDLQMPEVDGLGITRLIKSSVIVNQNVPIVAVTASASAEIRQRCMAAGMNGFLAKPVSIRELYDTLRPLLTTQEKNKV